jgi:predicted ATP-dependent endonuclease of OLD family
MTEDKKDENGEIIQEGLQIFYTTHSPNFLRTDEFHEIFIVRKTKEK